MTTVAPHFSIVFLPKFVHENAVWPMRFPLRASTAPGEGHRTIRSSALVPSHWGGNDENSLVVASGKKKQAAAEKA
jgi:hypothetical protein